MKLKLLKEYIKSSRIMLVAFVGTLILYVMTFYLYDIPLESTGYGSILVLCFLLLLGVYDYRRFYKKARYLLDAQNQQELSEIFFMKQEIILKGNFKACSIN